MPDPSTQADELLERALAESGGLDPRELYRDRLRELKRADPDGYEKAVAYYREVLLPTVASGEADPLDAWMEYGRRLAQSLDTGRTVTVDRSGRSEPYEGPTREGLVLHLPDRRGGRALLVGLPAQPSAAQRATYDALVDGKLRLRE